MAKISLSHFSNNRVPPVFEWSPHVLFTFRGIRSFVLVSARHRATCPPVNAAGKRKGPRTFFTLKTDPIRIRESETPGHIRGCGSAQCATGIGSGSTHTPRHINNITTRDPKIDHQETLFVNSCLSVRTRDLPQTVSLSRCAEILANKVQTLMAAGLLR